VADPSSSSAPRSLARDVSHSPRRVSGTQIRRIHKANRRETREIGLTEESHIRLEMQRSASATSCKPARYTPSTQRAFTGRAWIFSKQKLSGITPKRSSLRKTRSQQLAGIRDAGKAIERKTLKRDIEKYIVSFDLGVGRSRLVDVQTSC